MKYFQKKTMNNEGILVLNQDVSIVLPRFDTSSIFGKGVSEITLSLYLSKIFSNKTIQKIHLTINPFDPQTMETSAGLSLFIEPTIKSYINFKLPLELFEKTIGSHDLLLIKMVDNGINLEFNGVGNTGRGNCPKLVASYTEIGYPDHNKQPIVVSGDYYNVNLVQNSFGNGDNINGNKISDNAKEGFLSKFFWYFIAVIFATVVSGLILNNFFDIG